MNIRIVLPQWNWIGRLFDRYAANTEARAKAHGNAGRSKRWSNGFIDAEASIEVEYPKDKQDGS